MSARPRSVAGAADSLSALAEPFATIERSARDCSLEDVPELLGWTARLRGILELRLGEPSRELARVLEAREVSDAVLSLRDAARYMGEPPETFRRRGEYLKARVSRTGERRARYSRAELDRIKRDRLAESSMH